MTGIPIGKETEYWISFNIENNKKSISGVRVKICRALEKDMNASFKIDLCDHPLYPALVRYVEANPIKKDDRE